MEARNDNNSGILNKVIEPVWKAPHSGFVSAFVDDGEAQWRLRDGFLSLFHRLSEALPKMTTNIEIPP